MNKPLNNYAFIDGQNLNLSIQQMGWKLDFSKFRVYLMEKYKVEVAYYFIGYVDSQSELYRALQMAGYILVFKPTFRSADGKVKGNCDAELVLQAMIDLERYDKAVIVSGDGDFHCLVVHLNKIGKLGCVIAPNRLKCSHLLNLAAGQKMTYLNDLQKKLGYLKIP
jgi:uncharacterized LabA/DUF88 family protein